MTLAKCIGYLHTSPVHKETFQTLTHQIAADIKVLHHVDERLLKEAQKEGLNESVTIDTLQCLHELANQGADVVVCTCSSIGEVAENAHSESSIFMRIDRAMADLAV